jgi:adenosylcobinamide-GDP ribazoletransferase
MADALPWFPVVGCLLGLALYYPALAFGLVSGEWAGGAAAVVLAGSVLLTGGFHLDGLADWADAFGGGRDKEHTLAIMKDSHTGAFGVMAIALVLTVKYASLLRLADMKSLGLIIPVYIVSRATMVELAVCLPYARREQGTAGPFVDEARTSHRIGASLSALILLFVLDGVLGLILFAVGWAACRLLGFWFRRRIAGITGDLLGASGELIEAGLLLFSAAMGPWLHQFSIGRVVSI